ncbi:hypothetical protein QCA50_012035 [Cerrena zonata]|uniref:AMP-dependent synthetase/ligase domain-containing protein n=1 Tax=Cerrena zonata TaxID=2478898 RepID=A0AAW0G5B4_9APHY
MSPLTVVVGEARPGETAPRRKASQKQAAVEKPTDIKATTIPELVKECVGKHGKRNAMGWRDLIDTHIETKKIKKIIDGQEQEVDKDWTFFELSKYKYINYPDLLTLIEDYGKGLVSLGLTPDQTSKLHIFASTSHKWLQTFLAAASQSIPVVTAYDTLGESGLTHSLVQTESDAVFTDNALLSQLIKPLRKATSIKYIIHGEPIDEADKRNQGKNYKEAKEAKEEILKVNPDIKFFSYDDVLKLGKESDLKPSSNIKPEDLACIMYTSGSTGDPKGVIISHENILAAVGGVSTNAGRDLVSNNDRVIAFLPLAHILELVFELTAIWWGGCLGYANVKTLTDVSCKHCQSDLQEFKPTIMVGVAAVWESVRKGVLAKIKQMSPLIQKIFWTAYKAKTTMSNYHIPGASIFDVIFKKVKAATGGELKYVLNGGSPISKDAQIFISTLIAPMLVGYGLTETCANTTIVEHNHFEYGVAGSLTGAITAKLVDVADAGYFAKNNQGEVLLKGKCITKAYYKNEKETKEAFNDEGWFQTGDIGEWTSNGALKIIDLVKSH